MRIVFLGTPEAAVPSLRALVAAGHDVVAVVTRPDKRRGRGSTLSSSPVKEAALALGLEVHHRVGDLDAVEADLGVVVAYGRLIAPDVLVRLPMINVHFSLLPRWRGAAPVERAILAGDAETGVAIMRVDETLDTGEVYGVTTVAIGDQTASALTRDLADKGAALLVEVLARPNPLAEGVAQSGDVTYAEKLSPETFHLQPTMDVAEASRVVRLERAWCLIGEKRLRVHAAEPARGATVVAGTVLSEAGRVGLGVRDGILWLHEVQPEGSRAMAASAWWAGARLTPGTAWS